MISANEPSSVLPTLIAWTALGLRGLQDLITNAAAFTFLLELDVQAFRD
jgi:hypothetical protein